MPESKTRQNEARDALTRRSFLGLAGAVPLALAIGELRSAAATRRIPIAVQLYSVREECAKDLPKTLSAVAKKVGLNSSFRTSPGAHYWFIWRVFLGDFGSLIFR